MANTASISVNGAGGKDVLTLDGTTGALPSALIVGGPGDDTLTGGAGADSLFGQAGNDILLGKGAWTCCSAGPRTTPSREAMPTTRHSVRQAPTG